MAQTTSKGLSKTTKIIFAIIAIASLVLASICVVLFSKPPQTASNVQNDNSQNNNNPSGNTTPPRIILKVESSITNGHWTRDTTTDLPDYESTVSYTASNSGNLDATSVSVSISIDGNPYSNNVIPLIAMYDSYSSSFSYPTPYDQTRSVLIVASCQDASDSCSLSIGSAFPNSPYVSSDFSSIVELFVTPNEQNVVAMKDKILKDKFFLNPDWTALWMWVGSNIKYESEDSSNYHWQFPKDTLQSRYGMCADYSTLLVSFYRHGIFGPNDVYVVGGKDGKGQGHAWVIVKLAVIGWYTLDPQENGVFNVVFGQLFTVSGYKAEFEFNDQQFHNING